MANILIIEDEKAINNLIRKNLQLVGHQCYSKIGRASCRERVL